MRRWALLLLLVVGVDARALDQGEAFSACQAKVATLGEASCDSRFSVTDHFVSASCEAGSQNTASAGWYYAVQICANTANTQYPPDTVQAFQYSGDCSGRALEYGWAVPDPATNPQQLVCHEGCTYKAYVSPSTGENYFATLNEAGTDTLGLCSVGDYAEPVPDADGDGVPDANDAFPNDPNESADSDGDGIGDNADFSPNDPTDGQDTPGDTDGDDEGDNIAHGGGTCDAPPTCSGDGIQCAQLVTQWKIMCKGAKVSGSPEVCNTAYTCTGDSAQCAQVALLRAQACKAVVDSAAAQEILDGLKNGPADPGGDASGVWVAEDPANADDSGYGLARACPPPVQFYGKSIEMPCTLGQVIAALVLLAGFVQFGYALVK